MALLEVREVSVSFGGLRALADVSIGIEAGHVNGLIGPNGAGKTTLFNAITGVHPTDTDLVVLEEVGGLVATSYALACLGFRLTLAALAGADPSGSEASVRKLLGVVHDQELQEVGLGLLGAEGAIADGEGLFWSRGFLWNRNLTIAGGTSEIQRNIIGERVLGLPRDP